MANESRKVEGEFRLCKTYTMINHSDKQLVFNDKLNTFFKDHFKDKNTELQPELINPENYPHVFPPDDLTVYSNTPEIDEVQQV